ncbi:glutamate-5-semialdehyde dehydrogenase [Omnitrophica bacterium]|nr:glutamate-5-semialdehyde dehydrogenase [Candidatus Omnitrophota bacterium]
MSLQREIITVVKKAKAASRVLAALDTTTRDSTLLSMADGLLKKRDSILSANSADIKNAEQEGISSAMIDRLTLNEKRISSMAEGLRGIASLKDELGTITEMIKRPNGLWIGKMRVPIGVIAIIYESRPNVTSDCAGLTLKSGNSVILKGGSIAINSNVAIYNALSDSIRTAGLPEGAINIIKSTDRSAVRFLLRQDRYVDLVIPRGGEGLIKEVQNKSRIPIIKHYKGVCHVYVDEFANLDMAHKIAINAKLQRPGVCNAMESLLVHRDVAKRFLPVLLAEMKKEGVEFRGCRRTRRIAGYVKPVKASDWSTEYLDLILSVKVVSSLREAIEHIARYGSMHSDTIVTENYNNAMEFLTRVDSACVYLNASTRFTDGGEFGMGAEIGISTDKLHARGPMGLRELTSYKYVIFGNGQIRT